MSKHAPTQKPISGSSMRVAVVAARYNEVYVGALLEQVCSGLKRAGVKIELFDNLKKMFDRSRK